MKLHDTFYSYLVNIYRYQNEASYDTFYSYLVNIYRYQNEASYLSKLCNGVPNIIVETSWNVQVIAFLDCFF